MVQNGHSTLGPVWLSQQQYLNTAGPTTHVVTTSYSILMCVKGIIGFASVPFL